MITSWAETHISAAHKGDDGVMHGHTWRVRAYWAYSGQSAVDLKDRLQRCARELDHRVLAHELRRAEQLAGYIGRVTEAARVHMLRGMALSLQRWPFASVDSTDVAQNHNRPQNTAKAMADRWDAAQCPARWEVRALQGELVS